MATPKTDIEQSVGRILREKHSSPLVVDIVDSHDLFKNQWRKRKTFYKKENYKIIYTTSEKYTTDYSRWIVVYNPLCSKKADSPDGSKDNNNDNDNNSDNNSDADTEPQELCWLVKK
jgi:hypothetical protein